MARVQNEQTPLLERSSSNEQRQDEEHGDRTEEPETVSFDKEDDQDPRQWSRRRKMMNVGIIALMAILSPLASSMFTPGIKQIAESLKTSENQVIGATTGFVVMLGIGPLLLAPLSETFGRRPLYMICFGLFTLLQIPTALAVNVEMLIAFRTISGLFGSVGIANGGGTISDMFAPSERAGVFGWYLLGPLLGPTLGPLFGGLIVDNLEWRWVFWILLIICSINTTLGYFFLRETYAPVILAKRCQQATKEHGGEYKFEGQDTRPLSKKLGGSLIRPLRILFTQPIVLTMAAYQAIIFATMYSLYTQMSAIYGSPPHDFSTTQVGLLYLGPGIGFLLAVWFLVPYIDKTYNKMAKDNDNDGKPEYRLPLANVGSVLLPITMFWFAWTVEYKLHWFASISSTVLFGIGQVAVFNTVQNYYIDAFSKYAASAIAAGALLRSVVGGIVPLITPLVIQKVGNGWGWSIFGFLCLALAPSPLLFMRYGERLRERFAIEL